MLTEKYSNLIRNNSQKRFRNFVGGVELAKPNITKIL